MLGELATDVYEAGNYEQQYACHAQQDEADSIAAAMNEKIKEIEG